MPYPLASNRCVEGRGRLNESRATSGRCYCLPSKTDLENGNYIANYPKHTCSRENRTPPSWYDGMRLAYWSNSSRIRIAATVS